MALMAGSGYGSYEDAHNTRLFGDPVDVPLILASDTTLKDCGHLVTNFDQEDVIITQWPCSGNRPICPGTGRGGGVTQGLFSYKWKADTLIAHNAAVGLQGKDAFYVIGRLPEGANQTDRSHVLVREANAHPDGGQVFFPKNKEAFVALLAPPGDEVKIDDFKAFYFDGSCGLQIRPDVWRQPLYPARDEASFLGKQGAVHACKLFDSVVEFGKWMRVPLLPSLATIG